MLVVDAIKVVLLRRTTVQETADSVDIAEQLENELLLRGFTKNARGAWVSPSNGIVLSTVDVPTPQRLIELLDQM